MDRNEDRIIRIETDLVYLQDMVRELNDIVAKQQMLVTRLEKQNEVLAKRIEDLDTEARPNRKPPHY
ncbi:MAG: SlyX family protein [Spirochaetales bacterium]|nr:SlyX family protein [Spirochaetales bacterium]